MTEFCTLSSGSSGNCAFGRVGNFSFLVDAGISCRAVMNGLGSIGADPGGLGGIFITHEHVDHIRGLRVLLKRIHVPIYASPEVLDYLWEHDLAGCQCPMIPISPQHPVEFDGGVVRCFDTPHDSVHSLGFRIETHSGIRLGIATDLGFISDTVRENLDGCQMVLLESNYDLSMLQTGSYPYMLKRRIMGQRGHLCNDECAKELSLLIEGGTSHILLGHISAENNHPELAYQTAVCALAGEGKQVDRDYILQSAPRYEHSQMFRL